MGEKGDRYPSRDLTVGNGGWQRLFDYPEEPV